jgi:hypothetical protein
MGSIPDFMSLLIIMKMSDRLSEKQNSVPSRFRKSRNRSNHAVKCRNLAAEEDNAYMIARSAHCCAVLQLSLCCI